MLEIDLIQLNAKRTLISAIDLLWKKTDPCKKNIEDEVFDITNGKNNRLKYIFPNVNRNFSTHDFRKKFTELRVPVSPKKRFIPFSPVATEN